MYHIPRNPILIVKAPTLLLRARVNLLSRASKDAEVLVINGGECLQGHGRIGLQVQAFRNKGFRV